MAPATVLAILFAAALHAAWNALLRSGSDRLWSMTIMSTAVAAVCGALTFVVPAPAMASWGCMAVSGLLHIGYNLFLVRTYRGGDLGQTYPIARGASPLLVCVGAAVFARELPDPVSLLGVVLVSGGILALAFHGRRPPPGTLPSAVATGCFIGAYSVADGIGARLSGTPVGYTVWLCLTYGVMMPLIHIRLRGWRSLIRSRRETLTVAAGGVVSLLAYGMVIAAMTFGPMGPVSALRETSVVFAALLGRFFLNEKLTAQRLTACAVIALGAFCIGHNGGRG